MNVLLDSHALVWWLVAEPMEPAALEVIADGAAVVAVSAATVWELAVKRALGKLRYDGSFVAAIEREAFEPLPVSPAHAELAGALPAHHRDPFDRMLVSQAQVEGLTIVTRDPAFAAYDVAVLPC